ncbi:drug/metabolite transporter (DMT) superfamily protein (macronuclear) [Tetrahymena thermophila SB210]|uniref:Drug/metabolite transporter (DMT) superfamily protein n=1 Tax=Tetrahymena thermophila (strain SB210) TaxID=312017 RepID=Q22B45_TETTS|nr:drug/metabolite transporter (DMT) superfamily protein [Tetrahymena thermophila SB210]EAR82510.1 drug/metabolite transporter (DMT) superfamily protein [Tetrahymena thermophila SB210]|eukprot:XP_001030173.1 drug/metabolite transporter (DMT) superfamily protein [Tetrahymena thermophila SB210]
MSQEQIGISKRNSNPHAHSPSHHKFNSDSPFIAHKFDKHDQHDSQQFLHNFSTTIHNREKSQEKLQDFVEKEEHNSILHMHSLTNTNMKKSSFRRLSNANMNRLSEFHSQLIQNIHNKHRQRQSILQASALNFNFDDMIDKVQEIDDGKLVVKIGDQVNRYTIGPNMIAFFDQETKQNISNIQKPLYQRIPVFLSWFLVFYAAINGACIPPWIVSVPEEKYLRISWRFFLQTFMMIPFLLYERRNIPEDKKYQYEFSYIFKLENIKKVFMVAFTNSIWFTMVLFAFEWNFISHALVLSGLSQLFFSIHRRLNKEENHDYEYGGQAMVIFGVFCILADTLTYNSKEAPPSTKNYSNTYVYFREPWQRLIIGNLTSILVSFLMFKMSKHQAESRQIYPQFLSMTLVFLFTSINMTMSSYFFAGNYLFNDEFWGWLGIFNSEEFSGFLIMTIILGMGNFITNVLINKLFEPIVPATISLFEPIFSTIVLQIAGVQIMPRGLACLGYVFIVPGLFVIVLGQHLLSVRRKQDEEIKIQEQLQEEINRLEALQMHEIIQSSDSDDENDSENNDSVKSIGSKKPIN